MRIVTMHDAKTNLSRLIQAVLDGEEVVIARGSQPVARLVPLQARRPERRAGTLAGMITIHDRFFSPLPAEELALWEQ